MHFEAVKLLCKGSFPNAWFKIKISGPIKIFLLKDKEGISTRQMSAMEKSFVNMSQSIIRKTVCQAIDFLDSHNKIPSIILGIITL